MVFSPNAPQAVRPLRSGSASNRNVSFAVSANFARFSGLYGERPPASRPAPARSARPPPPDAGPLRRAAADAAGGFNGAASGEKAVLAARATSQYRDAAKLPATVSNNANTRIIEGKTFELKNGVWTDSAYDSLKSPRIETVKFASQEYFALMTSARVAKWLSVGDSLLLVLEKRSIRVEP